MKKNTKGVGKVIKAWAIGMKDERPLSYRFSYDGEIVFMTFPTRKDAQVFRGSQKEMDIFKVLIAPVAPKKTKKKH